MIKVFEASRDNKNDIINNGVMCPIPWIHFVAYPNGTAQICTHQSDHSVCVGNVFDNTFEEIIVHENLRKLRADMLAGKKNSLCSNCHAFEIANDRLSSRICYIDKYKHLLPNCISNTHDNGYFPRRY